jgi:molecular chaperone IbpA
MTKLSIHTLDIPALHRQLVGFDRIFDDLHRAFATPQQENYPPFNIIKLDETHHVVEVAVAGFSEDELDVTLEDNVLTVTGERKKTEGEKIEYVHKGISTKSFVRTITLGPDVEVRGGKVINGILSIALEHVVPEEKKAKKIAITFGK